MPVTFFMRIMRRHPSGASSAPRRTFIRRGTWNSPIASRLTTALTYYTIFAPMPPLFLLLVLAGPLPEGQNAQGILQRMIAGRLGAQEAS